MTGSPPVAPLHHSGQHGSQAIPWEGAGQDGFYPPLLVWAEAASRKNRSRYIWLSRVELLSLIAVAASVTTFVLAERYLWESDAGDRAPLRVLLPLLLICSFTAKIVNRKCDFHSSWFQCRAVAESIKSLSWRYVTRAAPFHGAPADSGIDKSFDRAIHEATEGSATLQQAGIPLGQGAGQITTPMRHQRASSLLQRQDWYLASRIDDQIRWYTAKAEQSEAMSARWFRVGVGVQVMLLAATIVAVPTLSLAVFIGLFATVSSATNALSRLGRHDTLRKGYVHAANELKLVRDAITEAESEETFSEGVDSAELAISREHGMWMARR